MAIRILQGYAWPELEVQATETKPVEMYAADFDNNGTIEQIITVYNGDSKLPAGLET